MTQPEIVMIKKKFPVNSILRRILIDKPLTRCFDCEGTRVIRTDYDFFETSSPHGLYPISIHRKKITNYFCPECGSRKVYAPNMDFQRD